MTTADDPPPLSSEESDKKLWEKLHIIFHPDTYKGSLEKITEKRWIYQEEKIIKEEISFVPLFYKIFDEILVDAAAAGNKQRDPQVTNIRVTIDVEDGRVTVWTNTLDTDVADANQNSSESSIWPGSSDSSVYFTEILIDTVDAQRFIRCQQVVTSNKRTRHISFNKDGLNSTMVSFKPDLAKFGMDRLENDTVSLMKRRVVDLAVCLGKDVKVELNGTCVLSSTFEDYIKLCHGTSDTFRIIDKVDDRWDVGVTLADEGLDQVSFVNNIATNEGGTHVNHITSQLCRSLALDANARKTTDIIDTLIYPGYLFVFVNATIDDPEFHSESKGRLMTPKAKFGSDCELTSAFLTRAAENNELRNGFMKTRSIDIAGLKDALLADTAYSKDTTLILTEGKAAQAFAIRGISTLDTDSYGLFPLKGKMLNVRKSSKNKARDYSVIKDIMDIIGLEFDKVYTDVKELRYGHLMIMADPDDDGLHIAGLVINLIQYMWPSLLEMPDFLLQFISPIIKATKAGDALSFYSKRDFEAWKKEVGTEAAAEYNIKYYKGLASYEAEYVDEYFVGFLTRTFVYNREKDEAALDLAFSARLVEKRRVWLEQNQGDGDYSVDYTKKTLSICEYIEKEFIEFSKADNRRSIASAIDGFKPVQRKIIHARFMNQEMKAGEVTNYHHGSTSLEDAIAGMAATDGANNIALLTTVGLGGKRQKGDDHVNPRYTIKVVSSIARLIFHIEDDDLLTSLYDIGVSIEPRWYIPIIPMVLVNGCDGIGTAYSSFVPSYNPLDVIVNIEHLLANENMVPMVPFYNGLNEAIQVIGTNEYRTRATVKKVPGRSCYSLVITQLPLPMAGEEYVKKLKRWQQKGMIKSYQASIGYNDIRIGLLDAMKDLPIEDLIQKFKLTSVFNTRNMYLFNQEGILKKYDTPEQIIEEFFNLRYEFYEMRLIDQLYKRKRELLRLQNEQKFIALESSQGFKSYSVQEFKAHGFDDEMELDKKAAVGEQVVRNIPSGKEYKYLMQLPSTRDQQQMKKVLQEYEEKIITKQKELEEYPRTVKELWLRDLNALRAELLKRMPNHVIP